MGENGNYLHFMAFRSHYLSPVECNYGMEDRELLAIVDIFRDWRFILYGTQAPVRILFDYTNLVIFTKK